MELNEKVVGSRDMFVTVRKSKGESINAACGMLVAAMR